MAISKADGHDTTYAYSLSNDGSVSIEAYLGNSLEKIVIPEKIDGINVSVIKSMNSLSGAKFKTVIIPKSIKEIRDFAFENCGIEKLHFEEGSCLERIGKQAFTSNKIKYCDIPDNQYNIEIEDFAFSNNEIEDLHLPKEVILYTGCFNNNKIRKLVVGKNWLFKTRGENNKRIEDGILYFQERHDRGGIIENSDYLEEIIFEEGGNSIAYYAFRENKNLKKITIPQSLETINDEAFYNCTSLSEIVLLQPKISFIQTSNGFMFRDIYGREAFKNCPLPVKTKAELLSLGIPKEAF